MDVDQLDFAGTGRGRPKGVQPEVTRVRSLRASDLALLASGRGVAVPTSRKLRERHHALARVLAHGAKQIEASAITGYSLATIQVLLKDENFKELLEQYKRVDNSVAAEFADRIKHLELAAVDRLQEIVEDDESPPSATTTLEIAKFAADRNGHSPVAKSVSINANVGLGARMAAAKNRLRGMMNQTEAPPKSISYGVPLLEELDIEID